MSGRARGASQRTLSFLGMGHDSSGGAMRLNRDSNDLEINWPDVGDAPVYPRMHKSGLKCAEALGATFIKNPIWRSSEDIVQLRRLGAGRVNLTMHESQKTSDVNSKILDVKVHLPGAVINVRYGAAGGAGAERARLLRHAICSYTAHAEI